MKKGILKQKKNNHNRKFNKNNKVQMSLKK